MHFCDDTGNLTFLGIDYEIAECLSRCGVGDTSSGLHLFLSPTPEAMEEVFILDGSHSKELHIRSLEKAVSWGNRSLKASGQTELVLCESEHVSY